MEEEQAQEALDGAFRMELLSLFAEFVHAYDVCGKLGYQSKQCLEFRFAEARLTAGKTARASVYASVGNFAHDMAVTDDSKFHFVCAEKLLWELATASAIDFIRVKPLLLSSVGIMMVHGLPERADFVMRTIGRLEGEVFRRGRRPRF